MHRAANLIPTITNTPIDVVNNVVDRGADRGADGRAGGCRCRRSTLPPIPQVPLTPEQAAGADPGPAAAADPALSRSAGTGAPAARPRRRAASRARSTFGGEKTQYPHVNARGDQ